MKIDSTQEVMTPAMYELEQLKAAKLAAQQDNALSLLPNRISLIVDTSGSMIHSFGTGSRSDAAATALRRIVAASNSKDTSYAILSYNSYSHVICPMGTGYAKLLATAFSPTGGTVLLPSLTHALEQRSNRCILLSDGGIYDIYECFLLIERTFVPNGIKIDTIAIGDANDDVMKRLAEMTGGVFRRANTPSELQDIFLSLEPKNYLLLEHHQP